MRLKSSLAILAPALFLDISQALPTEADSLQPAGTDPLGPEAAVPVLNSLPEDLLKSDAKEIPADLASDVALSVVDDSSKYSVTCNNRQWTYYYNWWPLINEVCDYVDDKLDLGWSGLYPGSHRWSGEAKQVHIAWKSTGKDCKATCRQVFNGLHSAAACRAEDFWMKEMATLVYEGCGEASYNIEYTLGPMPNHGTLLCWDQPVVPSYKPDPEVIQRFCKEAVGYIRDIGIEFLDLQERVGFFWTDYNQKVRRPENSSAYLDTGFLHLWIKPTQYSNVCKPGRRIHDEIQDLTVERCLQRFDVIEKQTKYLSFGGRYWADCFEWGIKASGYDGLKTPADAPRL